MFGLVVILNKKISFLHDELVQLRADLNRPYIMPTVIDNHRRILTAGAASPAVPRKSPKKAQLVKEAAITMKEVLPDLFDQTSELLELAAQVPNLGAQSITMEDTFDLYDHSFLIPVERADYVTDMFGAPVITILTLMCVFSPIFSNIFTLPKKKRKPESIAHSSKTPNRPNSHHQSSRTSATTTASKRRQ